MFIRIVAALTLILVLLSPIPTVSSAISSVSEFKSSSQGANSDGRIQSQNADQPSSSSGQPSTPPDTFKVPQVLSGNIGTTEWGQFQGDETHAGFSAWSGPTANHTTWNYTVGGSEDGLIESRNTLVATEPDTGHREFYGFNLTNGNLIYTGYTARTQFGDATSVSTFYPASGDGRVFLENHCVFCFFSEGPWFISDNVSTGNNIWQLGSPSAPTESSEYGWGLVSYSNGYVYYALHGTSTLTSYFGANAAVHWQQSLINGAISNLPTVTGNLLAI